jgi:3-hydroxymyristoyl/3-hydroxydecanoyl-(acyl carrier protein) dehydratase
MSGRRIEIPAGSPFFRGHFRDQPIFPGIAHPLLVTHLPIAEIPSLKLRSPVRPGDALDVSTTESDGTIRFELRRNGELVSQGTLRTAADGDQERILPPLENAPSAFPPVSTLIPHEPPARLLREVLEASAEGLTGIAQIPADSPFVHDGRAPSFLGLEAAAQGAAVLEALSRQDASGPRIGYLVGLRNARLHTPWLPAEQPFRVTVRLTGSAPPLSMYEVAVDEILHGSISTYLVPQA